MILTYHPVFDAYHCAFRLIRILSHDNVYKIERDKLRILDFYLEPISKLLSAPIGCKARGSAFSAKTVLDVLQYASEPFLPPALPTSFSLDLASKPVLK